MADTFGQYDSSDPVAVDNAAKEAARRERQDHETLRIWMNHENGRDLLYRFVFEHCHLGETFTALDDQGRSDTHRTYLHLGERNIGAWLDTQMRSHPELYMKMLQEAAIGEQLRNTRLIKQNEKKDERDGEG